MAPSCDHRSGEFRLIDALTRCQTVYFCGLAKNTGKTVALRQAMAEARARGQRIGVTSIGRDGEAFDAIYGTYAKPTLNFREGDLVVTTEGLVANDDCTIEKRFDIRTPMGGIVAARARRPCQLEVAGPCTVSGLRQVRRWLASHVDLVLVDGALDRKAASLPDLCDGVVLSSGAAVSDNLAEVLSQTAAVVDMVRQECDPDEPHAGALRFAPVFEDEQKLRSAILATDGTAIVQIEGALTERLADFLMREGLLRRCRLVADSFAKVFVSHKRWAHYRTQGLRLNYRRSVRVLSVTVNPTSPWNDGFDARALLQGMRSSLPSDVRVFDICSPTYGQALG